MPAAKAAASRWAHPPQPPYPRGHAQRLDGVPWKYPLVPLKIGVFQEIRDNVLTGKPYQAHGWFIARQNPIMSLPDRAKTIEAFNKTRFHRHGQSSFRMTPNGMPM